MSDFIADNQLWNKIFDRLAISMNSREENRHQDKTELHISTGMQSFTIGPVFKMQKKKVLLQHTVSESIKSVTVKGSFSDWQELQMVEVEPRKFSIAVALSVGRHEFIFVEDGVEHAINNNYLTCPNPFGGKNNFFDVHGYLYGDTTCECRVLPFRQASGWNKYLSSVQNALSKAGELKAAVTSKDSEKEKESSQMNKPTEKSGILCLNPPPISTVEMKVNKSSSNIAEPVEESVQKSIQTKKVKHGILHRFGRWIRKKFSRRG